MPSSLLQLIVISTSCFHFVHSQQNIFVCSTANEAATLSVASDYSYSVSVSGVTWLQGGDVALHYGGPDASTSTWISAAKQTLLPVSHEGSNGTDAVLGPYTSFTVSWEPSNSPAVQLFPFQTRFACYPQSGLISFDQLYPTGTLDVNISTYVSGKPEFAFDNFNISCTPTAAFPSFLINDEYSDIGYIEWAGEFSWHLNNWGRFYNLSSSKYVGGQIGGPVVLHNVSYPRTEPALVVGPLDDFKDVILAYNNISDHRSSSSWVFGPQGHLNVLPSGFSARVGIIVSSTTTTASSSSSSSSSISTREEEEQLEEQLEEQNQGELGDATTRHTVSSSPPISFPSEKTSFFSTTGITAAVYQYGAILRALHNTTRFSPEQDIGVSMLSMWTDNGQVLDGDYWDQQSVPQGQAGQVYINVTSFFQEQGIPVASIQLDPYWFARGSPGNGNWTAAYQIFGETGFQEMLASHNHSIRLTLYSFFWAVGSQNVFTEYKWIEGYADTFISGWLGRIAPEDSLSFYTELMRRCKLWNCIGFEIDFLDFQYFVFADAMTTVGLHKQFLQGLSTAGVNAQVPVQLCMPVPSDVLLSVDLPGVSNIRASDDNDLTYAPANRWSIGLTSLLHGALDIRPFFDGTWTYPMYTGEDAKNVPYPAGYAQNATELGMAISVLSTGPVGMGDKLGFTNGTLARLTCASNGVLLKPSLPASPIDRYFAINESGAQYLQADGSEVWFALSFIDMSVGSGLLSLDARGKNKEKLQRRRRSGGGSGGEEVVGRSSLSNYHPRGLERFPSQRQLQQQQQHETTSNATTMTTSNQFPIFTPCPFVTVLAVDIPFEHTFTLLPSDITPSLDLSGGSSTSSNTASSPCAASGLASAYVATIWSPGTAAMAERCADGVPALQCVTQFSSSSSPTSGGINISTGVASNQFQKGAPHPFEIISLSPVFANTGYALLGEIGKFTRVSPIRFPAVSSSSSSSVKASASNTNSTDPLNAPIMSFFVAGAGNETIVVHVLVPGNSTTTNTSSSSSTNNTTLLLDSSGIRVVEVQFPSEGAVQIVTCVGFFPSATCSVSSSSSSSSVSPD